jgi:hypothetical protein
VGLATTEMTHKASRMAQDLVVAAIGGLVAYAGVLAIVAAIIIAWLLPVSRGGRLHSGWAWW